MSFRRLTLIEIARKTSFSFCRFVQKTKKIERFARHPRYGCGKHQPQKYWKALGKALLNSGFLKERQMSKGSFGSVIGESCVKTVHVDF